MDSSNYLMFATTNSDFPSDLEKWTFTYKKMSAFRTRLLEAKIERISKEEKIKRVWQDWGTPENKISAEVKSSVFDKFLQYIADNDVHHGGTRAAKLAFREVIASYYFMRSLSLEMDGKWELDLRRRILKIVEREADEDTSALEKDGIQRQSILKVENSPPPAQEPEADQGPASHSRTANQPTYDYPTLASQADYQSEESDYSVNYRHHSENSSNSGD